MKNSNLPINIPNILTVCRILLIPLFVIFLLKDLLHFALIVFSFAAISDGLDGLFARYFNQYTILGAYLDPIADKLLLMSAFVCLAVLRILPGWLAVIVITRDILIVVGFAVFTITDISIEVKPSLASKITTLLQLSTVIFVLLDPGIAGAIIIRQSFFWITAAFTTLSGVHYIYIGMNIIQDASDSRAQK